ncbi:trypsin-like peptidase domain-containing protein [Candidatus Gracilibacteria bacterium]|nr:trypsin-like peptidase domain-containing protein [Candidatus Gracilibacteria bacterium]
MSISYSIIIPLIVVSFFSITSPVSGSESSIIRNIVKIKSYISYPDGSYVLSSYGSAIAIGPSQILTNAHVILGKDDLPTLNYEICFSADYTMVPICRDTARLIAYDSVADLAILELGHTNSLSPFVLSSTKIPIGSYVSMYGYPAIGGDTITRTEGKIAGYEQMMYKIDGTIDHGNSGGGAFNSSGELIGMPTAVVSDNASLGYMIPITRIANFLHKKTNNYEVPPQKTDRAFIQFISRLQSYPPNKGIYRWNNIMIRNPQRYGFTLKSTMISSDNRMAIWTLGDTYDRVSITLSCSDDAGQLTGWEVRRDGLKKEKEIYPGWNILSREDSDYLSITSSHRDYSPNTVLYYKGYDACFAEITSVDTKKDAKSIENALAFLKQRVSFRNSYTPASGQSNPYFSLSDISRDTRVIRSIDKNGLISVLIGFEIAPGDWFNATIEKREYSTIEELGAILDMDLNVITTWDQYLDTIANFGINKSEISTLTLNDANKGVLVSHYDSEKKSTTFTFQYLYKTQMEKYAYWSWSVSRDGDLSSHTNRLRQLFTLLKYPGTGFIK